MHSCLHQTVRPWRPCCTGPWRADRDNDRMTTSPKRRLFSKGVLFERRADVLFIQAPILNRVYLKYGLPWMICLHMSGFPFVILCVSAPSVFVLRWHLCFCALLWLTWPKRRKKADVDHLGEEGHCRRFFRPSSIQGLHHGLENRRVRYEKSALVSPWIRFFLLDI